MSAQLVTIAAFAGSLRKESYNRKLLRAAIKLAPEDVRIDALDIDDLPLFNGDLESEEHPLPSVKRICDAIRAADALLIVSPEYNFSIPAVTKNVLDWASRDETVLNDKPVAVMGASPGGFGTVRMQLQIRQVGILPNMHFLNEPAVIVSRCRDKFDSAGELTDEKSKTEVQELLAALAAFARRLKTAD